MYLREHEWSNELRRKRPEFNMATAAVQHAPSTAFGQKVETAIQSTLPRKHNVVTELYYYKENDDGTPPAPSYVG